MVKLTQEEKEILHELCKSFDEGTEEDRKKQAEINNLVSENFWNLI